MPIRVTLGMKKPYTSSLTAITLSYLTVVDWLMRSLKRLAVTYCSRYIV